MLSAMLMSPLWRWNYSRLVEKRKREGGDLPETDIWIYVNQLSPKKIGISTSYHVESKDISAAETNYPKEPLWGAPL